MSRNAQGTRKEESVDGYGINRYGVKKSQPTEKQEHIALVQWLELHSLLKDLFFHIPNGGHRVQKTITTKSGKRYTYSPEGVTMKRMGVRRGVSDICIPYPTKDHHGLWIELKPVKGGILSSEQKSWIEKMNALGFKAVECHGCDEAIKVIESYLM